MNLKKLFMSLDKHYWNESWNSEKWQKTEVSKTYTDILCGKFLKFIVLKTDWNLTWIFQGFADKIDFKNYGCKSTKNNKQQSITAITADLTSSKSIVITIFTAKHRHFVCLARNCGYTQR